MFRLPSNSFFPSNPWPDKEVEGKQSPEPSPDLRHSSQNALCADLSPNQACTLRNLTRFLGHAGAYKVNPILTRMLGGDAGSRFDGWLLTVSSQV